MGQRPDTPGGGGNAAAQITAGGGGKLLSLIQPGSIPGQQGQSENEKVYYLIVDLMSPTTREGALLELSKKREQWDDLALVLWHSFGEYARARDRRPCDSHLPRLDSSP